MKKYQKAALQYEKVPVTDEMRLSNRIMEIEFLLERINTSLTSINRKSDDLRQFALNEIAEQVGGFVGGLRSTITDRINAIEREAIAAIRKPRSRHAKVTEQE